MEESGAASGRWLRFVLWAARIMGACFVLVVVVIVGAYVINPGSPKGPPPSNWTNLAVFPFGVCLGYIIGWRKPLLGGLIAVGCFLAYWMLFMVASPLRGHTVLYALPAILYVVYGLLSRPGTRGDAASAP